MASIRTWHNYLGMIFAPSIVFFALTGTLQLFSLHEAHGGYEPPSLFEKLGMLHKDQVFKLKDPKPQQEPKPPEPSAPAAAAEDDGGQPVGTYLLKWYFAFVAVGLTVSTVLGVWMGLKGTIRRRRNLLLLGIGTVLPIVLTIFSK